MNTLAATRQPAHASASPDPLPAGSGHKREAFALGRELFMLRIRQGAAAVGIPAFIHSLSGSGPRGRTATQRFLVIDGGAGRAECAVTEQMLEEYADGSPDVDAEVRRITERLIQQLKDPYRPGQWLTVTARGPHAPERRARPRSGQMNAREDARWRQI